jgi:hypothetical protein
MEWFSKLFEIDKLPFKVVFLAAVVSGIVAFSPAPWLSSLQLDRFKNEFGLLIGITFLASTGLALTNITIYIFHLIRGAYEKMKSRAGLSDKLATLDNSERAILREFWIQERNTILIPINNPSAVGLINSRIIIIASKHGELSVYGMLYPCAIVESARKLLTNTILELPEAAPTEGEIRRIRESRPPFTRHIERRYWLRDL